MAAELTIKSVTLPKGDQKVGKLIFEEYPDKTIKFWSTDPFIPDLTVGKRALAAFETVKSKNPDYPDDKFLTSWGGVERKPKGKGGFGGGGAKRTPEETASIMAQSAIKSAVEYITAFDPIPQDAADRTVAIADQFYDAMVKMVQRGKGALA